MVGPWKPLPFQMEPSRLCDTKIWGQPNPKTGILQFPKAWSKHTKSTSIPAVPKSKAQRQFKGNLWQFPAVRFLRGFWLFSGWLFRLAHPLKVIQYALLADLKTSRAQFSFSCGDHVHGKRAISPSELHLLLFVLHFVFRSRFTAAA